MRARVGVFAAMLVVVSWPVPAPVAGSSETPAGAAQGAPSKAEEKKSATVSIQVKIAAEGAPSLPLESKIQWAGADDACKQIGEENKPIGPDGMVTLKVPMCKIKMMIFITGFDTKTVTLDLSKSPEKAKDTVHIAVKHQGAPEVSW